ncbi:hypothetical protein JDV09_18170 [Mycobacterium sp. Y57]|uniref:hypothetical protein n=1 Tax=Mycolicibacterium xanthum TaxID=2796469 RepID=UPI001C847E13|nr:hypothetical protein [Mycolicibacterium xanthum]MBX7434024.1 hypothetical protein [Mycolicibacterium xanthum]
MDALQALAQRCFAARANRDPDQTASLHTDQTTFCTHLGMAAVAGRTAVRDASLQTYAALAGGLR